MARKRCKNDDVEAKMVVPVVSIKGKVGAGERIIDDNIQLCFVPYIKYKKYKKQFILWQDRNKINCMINAYNKKDKEYLMYNEVYMPIVENK